MQLNSTPGTAWTHTLPDHFSPEVMETRIAPMYMMPVTFTAGILYGM